MTGTDEISLDGSPRADRLERCVLQVCDASGAFIEYWGFKSIHGRIWTLLALREESASQMQIGETLGVSRSLVSTAVAELTGYGLVRAVSDHRNSPYEAVMDVWPAISDVLREREWMLLEHARNAIEAAVEEVEVARSQGFETHYSLDRMRLLLTMTEMAQALLKILIALRVPKSMEGFGEWIGRARGLLQAFRAGV